jgi:hypothetical protein
MSSSQSSQFPPKSIVKNKSYEGVEALRQVASTSLFLDNEQKANGQTIPTIKEPDEGELVNQSCTILQQSNNFVWSESRVTALLQIVLSTL